MSIRKSCDIGHITKEKKIWDLKKRKRIGRKAEELSYERRRKKIRGPLEKRWFHLASFVWNFLKQNRIPNLCFQDPFGRLGSAPDLMISPLSPTHLFSSRSSSSPASFALFLSFSPCVFRISQRHSQAWSWIEGSRDC